MEGTAWSTHRMLSLVLIDAGHVECQHLLQLDDGVESVRGRTQWRPKHAKNLRKLGQVLAQNA